MYSRLGFQFAGFCSAVVIGLILLPGACVFGDPVDRDRTGKKNQMAHGNICKASDVIGSNVTNRQGEKLGDIKEIVIDRRNGQVLYAVLSFGGFLGMGDKLYAIPWTAIQSQDDDELVLDVDKETLASAPGFPKDQWPDFANQAWGRGIHDFYGSRMDDRQRQLIVNSPRDLQLDDADLERAATKLEVELDKGDRFSFRMSNLTGELTPTSAGGQGRNDEMRGRSMGRGVHDDTSVEITVDEVADKYLALRVRYTPHGQTSQMFLVRATENGDIVSVQPTGTPAGQRDGQPDDPGRTPPGRESPGTGVGGKGRAGAHGARAGIEEHVRSCLQFIVGERLHETRLQPGQTYATGTTLNHLLGTNGGVAKSPSSPGQEIQAATGISLRFEGTKEINGEDCAVFTVLCSHYNQGDANRTGPGADRGDQRGMQSMRDSGRVAYRLSDGLLESALVSATETPEKDGRIVLRRVKAGQQDRAVGGL